MVPDSSGRILIIPLKTISINHNKRVIWHIKRYTDLLFRMTDFPNINHIDPVPSASDYNYWISSTPQNGDLFCHTYLGSKKICADRRFFLHLPAAGTDLIGIGSWPEVQFTDGASYKPC